MSPQLSMSPMSCLGMQIFRNQSCITSKAKMSQSSCFHVLLFLPTAARGVLPPLLPPAFRCWPLEGRDFTGVPPRAALKSFRMAYVSETRSERINSCSVIYGLTDPPGFCPVLIPCERPGSQHPAHRRLVPGWECSRFLG